MKILITIIILITISRHVNSFTFIEYLTKTFNELANTFTVTINNIRNKVKKYILNKIVFDLTSDVENSNNNEYYSDDNITKEGNNKFDSITVISASDLVTMDGKKMETHVVRSKDGYLLILHRVLSCAPVHNRTKITNRTILLHHGLLGSSADWILLGPEKSLPYFLCQAGYDVWMANARGNFYSRGHVSLKVNSIQFWKFSWQEMGQFDLRAFIDYIRKFKKITEPINFIGHSMGCTALLVLLSVLPEYNKYLRIGVMLAPLVFMDNAEGPLKILATIASNPAEQILQLMGEGEFLSSRKIPKWIATKYCHGPIIYCRNPLFFLTGGITHNNTWSSTFIRRVLCHTPAGTSSDTILHYAQLIKTGRFHRYNDMNSEFPLEQVTLPLALFSSTGDKLAATSDVLKLYLNITNTVENYIISDKGMSHTDFVWGSEAHVVVFPKVVNLLDNFSNWNLNRTNKK